MRPLWNLTEVADDWADGQIVVLKGDGAEVSDCAGIVGPYQNEVHIAYVLDEVDLAQLAQGGRLWLTLIGTVPPHRLEVIGP